MKYEFEKIDSAGAEKSCIKSGNKNQKQSKNSKNIVIFGLEIGRKDKEES